MILHRMVFHAQNGAINQLVDGFKQATADHPNRPRILTDLTGPMNTMVMEMRHESLAAAEQWRAQLFASREFQEGNAREQDLIVSGVNEFYTIEQE